MGAVFSVLMPTVSVFCYLGAVYRFERKACAAVPRVQTACTELVDFLAVLDFALSRGLAAAGCQFALFLFTGVLARGVCSNPS